MTPMETYLIQNREHLYNQALKLSKSKDLANEWIQDLSIIILTDFNYKGEFSHTKMNTYCWGILLNMMRQSVRDKKKWVKEELSEGDSICELNVELKSLKRTFYEWELEKGGFGDIKIKTLSNIKFNLRLLEPYELNLYKMFFEENLSFGKISKRCGLPRSTVYNHYLKLVEKLKKLSESDGGVIY